MAVHSGTCGDNLTWSLETTSMTLTIQGTGAMSDFSSGGSPWDEHGEYIARVIFKEGVTSIGKYAFFNNNNGTYPHLTSIEFSDTIETIGVMAFSGSSSITELILPASLTTIHARAFDSCSGLVSIAFKGVKPSMPSSKIGGGTYYRQFYDVGNATVYSSGWASDSVFTTTIRGGATFTYKPLSELPPEYSIIPVNTKGVWRKSIPHVKVEGVWKKAVAWCKVKGIWKRIGSGFEGYTGLAVFFDANGGDGHIPPILTESTATIPDNAFSFAGHAFVGWNTAPDGSGTSYSVGQSITITANLTLYAIWIAVYTVAFNANGGEGTMASITGTTATVPSNAFSRSKHRFDRWNTKADGSGTSYTAGQTLTLSGDMTLYAIWIQQVTVTYYKTWSAGSTTVYPPASNTGPIDGGYLDFKVGGSTVPNLRDTFSESGNNSPTRTLTVDKGTSLYVMAKNYIDTNQCQIYVDGVSKVGPATTVEYNMPDGIQSDVTVHMTWRAVLTLGVLPNASWWVIRISGGGFTGYTVFFDANGGTGDMSSILTESSATIPSNTFTRDKYRFTGWNTSPDGSGTAYSAGQTISITSDVTLYAMWVAVHTVTFDANGGSGSTASIQTEGALIVPSNAFTRSGYVFNGWNTSPDGTGTAYSEGQTTTVTSDLTLYAVWIRQYIVTFNANGGTGTVADIVTTSTTATVPVNAFSRPGYIFTGWNSAADGSGTSYTEGQSLTLSTDMTLYAVWIRQYTVSFSANGGTGTIASIVTTSTTATVPANAFSRSGHRFDRWSTAADGSGTTYSAGQTITLTGDITLYAIWIQQFTIRYSKKWQGDNMLWHPPNSNTGPVGGG